MSAAPSLLIVNCNWVNEDQRGEGDIYIKDGRIDVIGQDLGSRQAARVLDARGKLLIPGLIDDQVHFREPGMEHKEDIASGSRAAVAGGITSFMDMPNTRPPALDLATLEAKYAIAARNSRANYSFYLGAGKHNIATIGALDPRNYCGIKLFMGSSTGDLLVDDEQCLADIFARAPCLLATHCEDAPTIRAFERLFTERYGVDIPMHCHPLIRSADACLKSSSLAVELARRHGTRLHVLHLTTATEIAQFSTDPVTDKRITAEVCVHHMAFDSGDYADHGTLIKCNPAIKQSSDREALLDGLIDGRIDVIGTDHAPHLLEEKDQPYLQAPAGLPLAEFALPALLEHYHNGRLSLELIVRKTSHGVARCFEILDRGFIREGYWADLVLVDLDSPTKVVRDGIVSKCAWSPFEGTVFRSRVVATVVSGQVAFEDGIFCDAPCGERLEFARTATI